MIRRKNNAQNKINHLQNRKAYQFRTPNSHDKHTFSPMFQSCFSETYGNILCNELYNQGCKRVYKIFDNIYFLQSELKKKNPTYIFKRKHVLQKRYKMMDLQSGVYSSRAAISHRTASTLWKTLINSTSDTCFHNFSCCLVSFLSKCKSDFLYIHCT